MGMAFTLEHLFLPVSGTGGGHIAGPGPSPGLHDPLDSFLKVAVPSSGNAHASQTKSDEPSPALCSRFLHADECSVSKTEFPMSVKPSLSKSVLVTINCRVWVNLSS